MTDIYDKLEEMLAEHGWEEVIEALAALRGTVVVSFTAEETIEMMRELKNPRRVCILEKATSPVDEALSDIRTINKLKEILLVAPEQRRVVVCLRLASKIVREYESDTDIYGSAIHYLMAVERAGRYMLRRQMIKVLTTQFEEDIVTDAIAQAVDTYNKERNKK